MHIIYVLCIKLEPAFSFLKQVGTKVVNTLKCINYSTPRLAAKSKLSSVISYTVFWFLYTTSTVSLTNKVNCEFLGFSKVNIYIRQSFLPVVHHYQDKAL